MSNTLITSDMIAQEALMQLENNCVMGNLVHRTYKKEFVKVGNKVSIRRPVKFKEQDGATLVKQDVQEGNTDITIDKRKHVGWEFSTQELTLDIEEYSERYIKPACISLANRVDKDLTGLYSSVWNQVGTYGTTPSNFMSLADVATRLDDNAVPDDGNRHLVMNPEAGYKVADDLKSTFIQSKNKTALEKGMIGDYATFGTYKDQNVSRHTIGTHGGTPLVAGADQNDTYAATKDSNSSSLVTDGWTASTLVLKKGDVFNIDGVYSVNPVGKDTQSFLQDFTVLEDVTSDGSGNATLTVSPAIITDDVLENEPYQTVSAAPADNAAITVIGTADGVHPVNMGFHKNAFALVMCPLEMPDGANFKSRKEHNGYSIRVIKDYDIIEDTEIIRLDILYGVRAIYPDLACRLAG